MYIHLTRIQNISLYASDSWNSEDYIVFTFTDKGYITLQGNIKTEEGALNMARYLHTTHPDVAILHNNKIIESWGNWTVKKITHECIHCDGDGSIENDCEECQGTGNNNADDDEWDCCEECRGRGTVDEECEYCNGTGEQKIE